MEQAKLRERIEDLMRGYGLLRVLVVPSLGLAAIVVVGWFLISSLLPPYLSPPAGPVVKNGVAAVVVCGNKRQGTLGLLEEGVISDIAPEAQTATWSIEERGRCEIYYQHPRNEE